MESIEADIDLIEGSFGEFKVTVDGKTIFSRRRLLGSFPEKGEILKLIS